MGEVTALQYFPLAGAEGVPVNEMKMWPTGPRGERSFVVYDAGHDNQVVGGEILRGVQVRPPQEWRPDAGIRVILGRGESLKVPFVSSIDPSEIDEVSVNDAGEIIDCMTVGREADDILGRAPWGLRMARVPIGWLLGVGKPPADRQRPPVRVVFEDSVRELADLLRTWASTDYQPNITPDRFRGHVVVEGFAPFAENGMVGCEKDGRPRHLRIGGLTLTRLSLVPYDTIFDWDRAGKYRGDVGRHTEHMGETADGRPGFALQGYPLLELGDNATVKVGDEVEYVGGGPI